jgi:tetratricopeptide (TPR) repeat protein
MNLIWVSLLILPVATSGEAYAASEYDLVIDANIRYFFDTGGGEMTITVRGELAQAVRQDLYEDEGYKINPNRTLNADDIKLFTEAIEDILELDIDPLSRKPYDEDPEDAGVDYTDGIYKMVKVGVKETKNVEINSVKGLLGTNQTHNSEFTIEMDIKGELVKDKTAVLSDGYVIVYALLGEKFNPSINVKETTVITTVGMSSYSDFKMDSGGEVKHYRLVMGDYIEYSHSYKLNGYEPSNLKKDTVSFDSFNIFQNALVLAIIIIIFSIIASMIGKYFVKKNEVNKVKHLRILAVVFFLILAIIYFLGVDGLTVWACTIVFFVINVVLSFGVYEKGWGNLAHVTVRHEDFVRKPPVIEDGPWHERGISNAKLGNFVEAVDCFEAALESEPENAVIWNDLGFVHRKLGNYRQAVDCFTKAIELRPDYPTAQENLDKAKKEMMTRRRKK